MAVCNLCSGQSVVKKMTIQGHDLVECVACKLNFLDPIPTDADIAAMYSKEYYQSQDSNKVGYTNYKQDVDLIIQTVIRRYRMIKSYLESRDHLKILDVGCAYGYYLDIARLYGWDTTGIEINPAAAQECVGVTQLNVLQMALAKANFAQDSFDLVSAWDLVEHVQDPMALFVEIHRVLKPGGSFVLATPDIESLPSTIMGQRWMGYKSKEHIYFFSQRTLTQYLEKIGFVVKECHYVGKYISRDLFINRLENYFGPIAVLAKFLSPATFYLNPFDIIYLRAEKK